MVRAAGGVARGPCTEGSALADVVVALVIVHTGLLAVLGVLTLTARVLERAKRIERATLVVREVADSLTAAGGTAAGARRFPWGDVRWEPEAGGWFRIEAIPPDSAQPPLVDARIRAP